jgi:GntR family transcriptional regulator
VSINPADPRPPYQQLADRLRTAIASGELAPGDALPSVRTLAATYQVSNTTAGKAIDMLKSEGLVDTHAGRGNIVRAKRPAFYVVSYLTAGPQGERMSWHAQMGDQGFEATQEIIEVATVSAPAEVAERLQLPAGAPAVVRRRILRIDGTPVQLADSYYPAEIAEGTELERPGKMRGYTFAALERLGIEIDYFRDDLYLRMPTPREAQALHLGKGVPVVRLLRTTYTTGGTPAEVTDQVLAGDRYVLSYEIPGHKRP